METNQPSDFLDQDDQGPVIPDPEEMLTRLKQVDVQSFNIEKIANELKGDKVWISILTIPVSAIILVSFTLLGSFLFDRPIVSFIVTALLLFWISKMFEQHERNYKIAARQEVINRVRATEGEFGLIPHFKHFLPTKYRHLWQSLKKGNYMYVEQYVQAILLLQNKLDPQQFIRIWYLTYPEIAPEDFEP
jgi:hypothetical protein